MRNWKQLNEGLNITSSNFTRPDKQAILLDRLEFREGDTVHCQTTRSDGSLYQVFGKVLLIMPWGGMPEDEWINHSVVIEDELGYRSHWRPSKVHNLRTKTTPEKELD